MLSYFVVICNYMVENKAYFTPDPTTAPQLLARVLFSGAHEKPTVTFFVDESPESKTVIPKLVAVTLSPITEVCATERGLSILGRNSATSLLGRLSVDTSVEPPSATYSEPLEA